MRLHVQNRQANAESLLRECNQVRTLFTPENSYRVRVSAYNATARSQQVRAAAAQEHPFTAESWLIILYGS